MTSEIRLELEKKDAQNPVKPAGKGSAAWEHVEIGKEQGGLLSWSWKQLPSVTPLQTLIRKSNQPPKQGSTADDVEM